MSSSRASKTILIALAGALIAASMSGCYRRVTRASGIGSDDAAPEIHKRQTTFTQDIGNAIRDNREKRR